MADNGSQHFCEVNYTSCEAILDDEDAIGIAISRHFRDWGIHDLKESLGRAVASADATTVHCDARPANLRLMIEDARASIVLALQRHWDNEQYRRRLMLEEHYRLLQSQLSENFHQLMVRTSHWDGFRYPKGLEPNLVTQYRTEIDRLERALCSGTGD
jgi:hypothetical protein